MTVETVAHVYSPHYHKEIPARFFYEAGEQSIPSGMCHVWRLRWIEYLDPQPS